MNVLFSLLLFIGLGGWFSDHSKSEIDSLQQAIVPVFKEGDLERSVELAEQSVRFSRELEYAYGEAEGYFILAHIYRTMNNTNKAFYMYLKAARILEFQNDEQSAKLYTDIILNTGSILRLNYKYNEALDLYHKGLRLSEKWNLQEQGIKLKYNLASTLRNKGESTKNEEDLTKGIKLIDEIIPLTVKYDLKSVTTKCWNLRGLLMLDSDLFENARESFFKILDAPHSNADDKASALHNVALSYKKQNNDSATYYLNLALEFKTALNDPELLFTTLYEIAEYHLLKKDYSNARTIGNKAEDLYLSTQRSPKSFDLFYLLSEVSFKSDDIERAEYYVKKFRDESLAFHERQEDLISQLKSFQTDLIQAGFELEQKAITLQAEFNRNLSLIALIIVVTVVSAYWIHRTRKERTLTRRTKEIRRMLYGDEDPE